MTDSKTITLAGVDYQVRPLVWKQLRKALPAFARMRDANKAGITEEGLDEMTTVIAAALSRDYPDLTAEAISEMEVSQDEMRASIATVASLSGMGKRTDAPSGEAKATGEQ